MEEMGGAQSNSATDAGRIADVEISISKCQNCWHALGFDAQGTEFQGETCGTGLPGRPFNDVQHRNTGGVVLQMPLLHTCKQE